MFEYSVVGLLLTLVLIGDTTFARDIFGGGAKAVVFNHSQQAVSQKPTKDLIVSFYYDTIRFTWKRCGSEMDSAVPTERVLGYVR